MGMDGWQWEFLGTEGFILVPRQARHSILRAFWLGTAQTLAKHERVSH